MKQLFLNYKNGQIGMEDVPVPKVNNNIVIVKTSYSFVSMGTEMMKLKNAKMNLLEKAKAKPEQVKKVIETVYQQGLTVAYRKAMNKLDSLSPIGYSISGEVIEIGANVKDINVGDYVACGGAGYANHSEYNAVPYNLCVKIPNTNILKESSMATVGSIAINALRQAECMFGETIVIIGLGVVGQLILQIAKSAGIRVIGIDIDVNKISLAKENGAIDAFDYSANLSNRILANTVGRGADRVILTISGNSDDIMSKIPDFIRDRGTVVDVGVTNMTIPWQKYYDKEITVKMARSYGPGRYDPMYEEYGQDYPIGYVRWTERRNMETFVNMLNDRKLDVEYIISEEIDFNKSVEFYKNDKKNILSVVFKYDNLKSKGISRTFELKKQIEIKGTGIAVIGAGNFVKTMLLPSLKKTGIPFRAVVTSTGMSAKDAARKFGFEIISTSYEDILKRDDISSVVIGTHHSSHAELISKSLEKGKFVFCEKPMAINRDELNDITKCVEKYGGKLFIGYNRRFSESIIKAKSFLSSKEPAYIYYRINAGYMKRDNWYTHPGEGGRIVGEVGHFIDTILFLLDRKPMWVDAKFIDINREDAPSNENISINIGFKDGSLATIVYIAFGGSSVSKEIIEISSNMQTILIDNFKKLIRYANAAKKIPLKTKDKGHSREMEIFADVIKGKRRNPFSYDELYLVSHVLFSAIESAQTGEVIVL